MKTLNRKGFTLIELLVAVLVIGIVSALVYPKFGPVKERTYVAAMKNTLNKLVTAQENYMDANDVYSAETCTDGACTGALSTGTGFEADEDVSLTATTTTDASYGFYAIATHSKTQTQCGVEYGAAGPGAGQEFNGKIVCNPSGAPASVDGTP